MKEINFNSNKIEDILFVIKHTCITCDIVKLYVSIELLNALTKYNQSRICNFKDSDGINHCTIFGLPIVARNNLHGLEAYYEDLMSLFSW